MKILHLKAEDFKIFESIDVNLDGKSTIIFGINGTGKSTFLDIINYMFYGLISEINPLQGQSYELFLPEQIHIGKSSFSFSINVNINNKFFVFETDFKKDNTLKYSTSSDKNAEFINYFKNTYFSDKNKNIPILVNYSVNRLVSDIPLNIKDQQFTQISALENAIENKITFNDFFEWYRNREDIENEYKVEDNTYEDISLKCVRTAVNNILGNVSDLRVRRNPLRMLVKKDNKEIRVDLLSDGEKCTLALFGDIARRLALANPNLENPLNGEGIVLIDEIELHMHPTWQMKVLNILKETFPNIQFIITTHSPQVLYNADNSYNILLFENNGEGCNIKNIERLDGFDSNYILEEYMGAKSRNSKINKLFKEVYHLIDDKKYEEAEKQINALKEISGNNYADIITVEGYLKRSKILNDRNK